MNQLEDAMKNLSLCSATVAAALNPILGPEQFARRTQNMKPEDDQEFPRYRELTIDICREAIPL